MIEQIPHERNMTLEETADLIGIDRDLFVERLVADGYISGRTQSLEARKLRVFYVNQGVSMGNKGILNRTRLSILVTPKGQKYFKKLYGDLASQTSP